MGWCLFSEDKNEVERDDGEQVIPHKHCPSPRRCRCCHRGATMVPPLPPPWRRCCLLFAATTAFSTPPPLPSRRRRRCNLVAAAAAFSSSSPPLPSLAWRRCHRPPLHLHPPTARSVLRSCQVVLHPFPPYAGIWWRKPCWR
jgi:hypothetical protein